MRKSMMRLEKFTKNHLSCGDITVFDRLLLRLCFPNSSSRYGFRRMTNQLLIPKDYSICHNHLPNHSNCMPVVYFRILQYQDFGGTQIETGLCKIHQSTENLFAGLPRKTHSTRMQWDSHNLRMSCLEWQEVMLSKASTW